MQTLLAVLPLFLMIAFGFGAARTRLADAAAVNGIVNFIYYFAIPPMMVAMLANADGEKLLNGGPFLLAMLTVELVIAGVAGLWAWRAYGAATIGAPGFGILGFSACFANGVFLGLPLTVAAFGPEAAAPALLLILLDMFLFVIVTFFLEFGRMGGREATVRAVVAVAKNPIIIATFVGLALAFTGWKPPEAIQDFIDFVAPAAAPTALFALGATLAMQPVSRAAAAPAGVITFLKLFAQPALAAALLAVWPGVDPLWRVVGIVYTAGPVGMNAYLFAARYNIGVPPVSTAIVFSTALSVLTLSALLLWFAAPP